MTAHRPQLPPPAPPVQSPDVPPYTDGEKRFIRWLVRQVVRDHRERAQQQREEDAA